LLILGKRSAAGIGDGVPVGAGRLAWVGTCVKIEVSGVKAEVGVKVMGDEGVDVEASAGKRVAEGTGVSVEAEAAHFG